MTRMMRILCIALLTIAGLGASSIPARADDKCERRIHQAEDKLRDMDHHDHDHDQH